MHPEYEPWPESPLNTHGLYIWYLSKLLTVAGFTEAALLYEASDYKGVCIALLGVGVSTTVAQLNHEWNREKNT